jgi:hypothetical protein
MKKAAIRVTLPVEFVGHWPFVRRRKPRTRGQAMVEFALVAPIMVLLIMGALQVALISMVWISLQGLAQDSARWMAISSPSDATYPRPRWADGQDGVAYRNASLPPAMTAARFTAWSWNPPCASGVDCITSGARRSDQMLVLTATYNWDNLMIMPIGIGTMFGWSFPTTITVKGAEVMQY